MSIGLLFWVLMVIWAVFNFWAFWTPAGQPYGLRGNGAFLFVLFFLLGWHAFGFVIHQ